jgi:hypothetical protein
MKARIAIKPDIRRVATALFTGPGVNAQEPVVNAIFRRAIAFQPRVPNFQGQDLSYVGALTPLLPTTFHSGDITQFPLSFQSLGSSDIDYLRFSRK